MQLCSINGGPSSTSGGRSPAGPANFAAAFELLCEGAGADAWQMLGELRRNGHGIVEIAATPMSQILDQKRREMWAKMKEPARPEHPPARYLLSKLNYSLEPLENARGGEDGRRLSAEYARRHAEDAAAQAEWERGAS